MLKSLVIFIFTLATANALAIPLKFSEGAERSFLFAAYNFNGVAKLSNCSASIVKFRGASDDSLALLLTNGHCMGIGSRVVMGSKMPAPGEVIQKTPIKMNVELLSDDGKGTVGKVAATEVVYGTMTDTDMAILRLNKTYAELKAQFSVGALLLADRQAVVGTPIQILSGYWRRGYSCNVDGYVHILKEDSWTFKNSIRYSEQGCKIIGGTSGSPVVSVTSGEVVGVNNTINMDGEKCSLNNPCEVNERGDVSIYRNGGYAQHTEWLYSCLDSRGELNLKVNGCVLPK